MILKVYLRTGHIPIYNSCSQKSLTSVFLHVFRMVSPIFNIFFHCQPRYFPFQLSPAGILLPGSWHVAVQAMATAGHATAHGLLGTHHFGHPDGRGWCQDLLRRMDDNLWIFKREPMIFQGESKLTWIWRFGSDLNDRFEGFFEQSEGTSLFVFPVVKMDATQGVWRCHCRWRRRWFMGVKPMP
jgi:hypothetical protein